MARIMHERVPLAVIEGGENMAEFQPDPFLTSLGMSVDQQRAYDAYCDAIVDASEAEMKRTGVTYTLDEVFEHAHEEVERLKREYPREDWGRHVPSKNHRSLRCEHSADNAELVLFRDRRSDQGLKTSLVAALVNVRTFPEAYPRTGKARRRFVFEFRSIPHVVLYAFDGELVVLHDIHFARSAQTAHWLSE